MSRSKYVALILSAIIAVQPCINVLAEDNIEENLVEIETIGGIESYGFEENISRKPEIFEYKDGYDTNENISINVIENETEIINDREPHDFGEIVDETNANDMETEPVSNIEDTLNDADNSEEKIIIEEIVTGLNTPVLVSAGNVADGYYIGTLTVPIQTDTDGNAFIGFDNVLYPVSDNFDFRNMTSVIDSNNKEVVYVVEKGVISEAYACGDMMSPYVKVTSDPKELLYKNGKLNTYSFKINVNISNALKGKYDFLPSQIKNSLGTTLTNLKITPSSDDINFGKNGFWIFGNDITEINETLNQKIGCKGSISYSYTVNINNNYKLLAANSFLGIDVLATTTNGEVDTNAYVSVGNLDYQTQVAEESKESTERGKAVTASKNSIYYNAESNVAFDAFLSTYLNTKQIKICKDYIYTYAGTMMAATTGKYSSTDKIMDKVFSKLGIDKNMLTYTKKLVGTTSISFGDIRVDFVIDMGSFRLGDNNAYAAMGNIKYSIYKGYKVTGGTGMITYTDVKTFVDSLKDIAESTIKNLYSIWGDDADKIAAYLTEGTIIETLRNEGIIGNFSDNLYIVLTEPTKRYTKTLIECPVDIEVYDFSGNLCGAIKDNNVDTAYHDIYMYVDGDKKYVYLSANDYYLKLVGNDTGSMDYTVEEYNSDGSLVRRIIYNDVPLNSGRLYTATVPEAGTFPTEIYDLMDTSGNVINATSDSITELQSTDRRKLIWNLSDDGVLTISGNVGMEYSTSNPPWDDQRDEITSVVIEEGITSITGAFYEHKNLRNIVIPSSVTTIGRYTFGRCQSLESISIPDNVTLIDESAFSNCTSLTNVIIPDSVKEIGESAFAFCTDLCDITIGKGVSEIGNCAFRETGLVNVVLPDNVRLSGCTMDIFYGCKKLVSVTVGSGITTNLESLASDIDNYDSFTGFIVSDDNPAYSSQNGILFNKEKTVLYKYPNGKTDTSYIVPDTVTRISNNGAFSGCKNLTTITIPSSVTYIDYNTFSNCTNLMSLIFKGDAPEFIGNGSFYNVASKFAIYYPPNNSTWTPIPINYSPVGWASLSRIKLLAYCKMLDDGTVDLEHNYTEKIIQAVSCTADGLCQYECSKCGNSYTENIDSLGGHLWYNATVTKPATCTEKGINSKTCKRCGYVETTSFPTTGHSYGKYLVKKEATVFGEGIQTRICKVCGSVDSKSIAKLKATMKLTALSITLKEKQSTSKIKVTGLAKGDTVKSWKSSNTKIVKVNSKGKITAQAKTGKATITVTLKSGLSKKITVKVQKSAVACTKLALNKSSVSLKKGKTFILKPMIKPITCVQKIKYSSSDKKVATVSSKGKITAKKKGKATITVTVGKKKVKCKVTVK